jgi:iron(III) transport system substrate-binding protein
MAINLSRSASAFRSRLPAFHFLLAAFCLLLPVLSLSACWRDASPKVVLYVSADEHVARQVINAFEQQTGVRVLMVGDTEVKKTTGLVERLRNEKSKPQADVFWSSEIFMTIELAEEGLFDKFELATGVPTAESSSFTTDSPQPSRDSPLPPARYRDPQGRWYGFAGRARVIAYAPDRLADDEVPKTWMALTQDRFRGRIVMADPRFGTTGGHLAAMKTYWDRHVMPGYYAAFLDGLADNKVRLLAGGNAAVVDAVVRGEADLGMTDSDDVWAAQAQGHNIELIYPNHSTEMDERGIGTLLIPNTVALIKGAPHPVQARQLMAFLLSEHVERLLVESPSHNMPLRPSLADAYPQYAIPDPLQVDYHQAAKMRSAAIQQAMSRLRDLARGPTSHWTNSNQSMARSQDNPMAQSRSANAH